MPLFVINLSKVFVFAKSITSSIISYNNYVHISDIFKSKDKKKPPCNGDKVRYGDGWMWNHGIYLLSNTSLETRNKEF